MTDNNSGQNPVQPVQKDENEIIARKKEKVAQLRAAGIHPYANDIKPDILASEFKDKYASTPKEELEKTGKPDKHSIAGRVMSMRVMGKLAFGHIKDQSGRLQVVFSKDLMGESFDEFKKNVDVGDIIWVKGEAFVTRTGEISLLASEQKLLTKNVRPLPEKFHGLTDKELRYRQRYLDMIMNDEVRENFVKRTKAINFIRNYMNEHSFLEVETPMMHPLVSGAAARPFITHHNTLDMQLYMRIAPECYLKRLLVGGMGGVYEINRNFRNEGISIKHNPEFTMMEFYWPYATYTDLMSFTEDMVSKLVQEITGSTKVVYQGKEIDFTAPWRRMTIEESLLKYEVVTPDEMKTVEGLRAAALRHGFKPEDTMKWSWFKLLVELFEEKVEEHLWEPTFIMKYPTEVSPLARRNDENPDYTDRFELFIAGREIANAFSEQNDPQSQYEAFEKQVEGKKKGDQEAADMDYDYIRALEYGMPPAGGEGIGIDRLVMLITDAASIRDVILFPLLRPEN